MAEGIELVKESRNSTNTKERSRFLKLALECFERSIRVSPANTSSLAQMAYVLQQLSEINVSSHEREHFWSQAKDSINNCLGSLEMIHIVSPKVKSEYRIKMPYLAP